MINKEECFGLIQKELRELFGSDKFNFKIIGNRYSDKDYLDNQFILCYCSDTYLDQLHSTASDSEETENYIYSFNALFAKLNGQLVYRSDQYKATETGGIVKVYHTKIANNFLNFFLISPLCSTEEIKAIEETMEFIFKEGTDKQMDYFKDPVFIKMFLFVKQKFIRGFN